ncbi:MAG TPA: universal stress protein [Pirellulales bacterium]|nr:universal stress protein [Pirellulales bacterium]
MSVKFNKICVATDFSESAARAFEYAVALAEPYGAELHVLHVLQDLGPVARSGDQRLSLEIAREYFNRLRDHDDENRDDENRDDESGASAKASPAGDEPANPRVLENLERHAEEQFTALAASNGAQRNFVRAVRFGNPVDEICGYIRRQGIDLLVVGTHGRTGINRVLMGSVAERLVREIPSAVLTVRGRRKEAVES